MVIDPATLFGFLNDSMLAKPSAMQRDGVIKTNSCVIMHEEDGTESQNTAPKTISNFFSPPLLCVYLSHYFAEWK